MLADLSESERDQVLYFLKNGEFTKAKALHDLFLERGQVKEVSKTHVVSPTSAIKVF